MSKESVEGSRGLGVAPVELCLEFVNTEGMVRNNPPDRLDSLSLFLEWAAGRHLVDPDERGRLAAAVGGPAGESDFLAGARELREALYRIFSAIGSGANPLPADGAVLERHLATALPRLRLVRGQDSYSWELDRPLARPDDLLEPIALSAADLLRSERLDRVKECDSETCAWLFIDGSRNRSRRWCDMGDCGNRAKARRYYRRHAKSG